jgi:alkanesulfonate monooxygenase SsuD/methylene tetrahydromethanopterin reductase-like flavin-dependent oxidoreductase (luciferase family)
MPPLAIGLSLPNRGVLFGATTVDEMLRMSEVADRSGAFDSVWVGDSLFAKPRLEAVTTLAAIAARTSRVKLGTACLASFPLRDPRLFALQWASLDVISGGRSLLCVCLGASSGSGMGEARAEVDIMAFEPRERVGRFEEGVEILRRLWGGDRVTHEGAFYRFANATLAPKPIQQPCPIWIANDPPKDKPEVERRACQRVARLADGWMTVQLAPGMLAGSWSRIRTYLEEEGRRPQDFPTMAYHNINIGPSRQGALEESKRFLDAYYGPVFSPSMVEAWTAAGSPAECVEHLRALRRDGAKTITLRITSWDQEAQFKRMVDEVLPEV